MRSASAIFGNTESGGGKMTDDQKRKLADLLIGTPDSVEYALEELGLDVSADDAEDALADVNIERCPDCDWWCESGELIDEEGNLVGCQACRPHNDSD